MDDLFLIIFMLSSLAIVIFALLAIIQFVKKNRVKGKKQLNLTGIAFISTFISIIGFSVTMDSTEGEEEDKITTSTEENDADKTKEMAAFGMIYGQQLLIAYQKETLMFKQHINIWRLWKLIIEY